jgi:glutaminyl-peptide cyclotransferase
MKTVAALAFAAFIASGPAAWSQQDKRTDIDAGHRQVSRERILDQTAIPVFNYTIARTYPHDTTSYTEGLVMQDGRLYEGTGRYGMSELRLNDIETGKAIRQYDLGPIYFGEGVTVFGERIFQLTYISNKGFIYDRETFALEQSFDFPMQGWGLTHDGTHLLMSDGSSSVRFIDPQTLQTEKTIYVSDDVGPVGFLNELEYVDGRLYANVWQTDFIAIIDPATGKITGWIDLTGLNPDPEKLVYPYVLNGIAFNEATGRLIVTGKCWPSMWEIDLVERSR